MHILQVVVLLVSSSRADVMKQIKKLCNNWKHTKSNSNKGNCQENAAMRAESAEQKKRSELEKKLEGEPSEPNAK